MFRLFKHWHRQEAEQKAAGHIAGFILKMQLRVAGYLSAKEKRLSVFQKKIYFILAGCLFLSWIISVFISICTKPDPMRIKAEWLKIPPPKSPDSLRVLVPLKDKKQIFYKHPKKSGNETTDDSTKKKEKGTACPADPHSSLFYPALLGTWRR